MWAEKGGGNLGDHCSQSISLQCSYAARKYYGEDQDAVAFCTFRMKLKYRQQKEKNPVPGVVCSPETQSYLSFCYEWSVVCY